MDGTIRFLRNVMGLWCSPRCGAPGDRGDEPHALLTEAEKAPAPRSVVDVDAPAFLPPGT